MGTRARGGLPHEGQPLHATTASRNLALSMQKDICIIFLKLLCANNGNMLQTQTEVNPEMDMQFSCHP